MAGVIFLLLLSLLLQPAAGAASRDEPLNFCSRRLTSAALRRLDPLLYMHFKRIETLLDRMGGVSVHYSYVDSSRTGPALSAVLEAVGSDRAQLPLLEPHTDFSIEVYSNNGEVTVIQGSLVQTELKQGTKAIQELRLAMGNISVDRPFSDAETLILLLALSSSGRTNRLALDFQLHPGDEQLWATLINGFKNFPPNDLATAIGLPAISHFLTVVPFKLLSLSLARWDEHDPPVLRLTFDTRRLAMLTEHLMSKSK